MTQPYTTLDIAADEYVVANANQSADSGDIPDDQDDETDDVSAVSSRDSQGKTKHEVRGEAYDECIQNAKCRRNRPEVADFRCRTTVHLFQP